MGATGILNVLDRRTGSVIWSRNAAIDNKVKVVTWGFAGSPLVINDIVIVALSGKLAAYDTADGKPRWSCPDGGHSYSSPHLAMIDDIQQVILNTRSATISVDPASGKQLWNYPWKVVNIIV